MQEDVPLPLKELQEKTHDPDEFLEYLNSEPLEPEMDVDEALERAMPRCGICGSAVKLSDDGTPYCERCGELDEDEITMDKEQLEAAVRKGMRLFIRAANESDEVWEHMMATKAQGDGEYRAMMRAIGRETPDLAGQINELRLHKFMTGYAILCAKWLFEEREKNG